MALGDSLEFLGAIFFAMHVILIGWLVKRVHVYQLAVYQYFICGLLSVSIGLAVETNSLQGWLQSGWSMVYTGVLSVGVGYTLQAAGQRIAPPSDAAIILSMEAVFAAVFGWLLLGELLTPIQLVGCGFMLAGMLLAQANVIVKKEE